MPREIPDPPASWITTYATLASDLDMEATTIADAMASLRHFWSAANATDHQENRHAEDEGRPNDRNR